MRTTITAALLVLAGAVVVVTTSPKWPQVSTEANALDARTGLVEREVEVSTEMLAVWTVGDAIQGCLVTVPAMVDASWKTMLLAGAVPAYWLAEVGGCAKSRVLNAWDDLARQRCDPAVLHQRSISEGQGAGLFCRLHPTMPSQASSAPVGLEKKDVPKPTVPDGAAA